MTADAARAWLIWASLVLSALVFVFFLLAPITGYPLDWPASLRVFEIVVPVFAGYLGASTQFVFRSLAGVTNKGIPAEATNRFLGLLVVGPIVLFLIAMTSLAVAFGISNAPGAPVGSGMSVDVLAAGTTAALGLLTVTTNVAVSYLFSLDPESTARRAADRQGSRR